MSFDKSAIRIAVDGPSGAGKGELSRALAARLGILYLDTGALYRAVGLYVCRKGVGRDDCDGIIRCLPEIDVSLKRENGRQIVLLCGEDVSELIRQDEISLYASAVSRIREVRAFLDRLQRDCAAAGGVVMDGRDIGTVIMPDAPLKIYLTASVEVRAKRRYLEEQKRGREAVYEEILARMKERDAADSSRETAPAVAAADARTLDSSDLDIEGMIGAALAMVREVWSDAAANGERA